jgi:Na+-driven multidrug efflux pump
MSGVVLIFHKPLLGLYGVIPAAEGSLEQLAFDAAITRMGYITAPYFLCGLMEVCTGVLRGLGKSLTSTMISLIGACLLRVVWLWTVFPSSQTLGTIFVVYPISWVATNLVAFIIIQVLLKKMVKKAEV